jgi:hypothetical protein
MIITGRGVMRKAGQKSLLRLNKNKEEAFL